MNQYYGIAGTVPALKKLFNLLNLLMIMKLIWRGLTVFFPHSKAIGERRGSATSACVLHRNGSIFAQLGVIILSGFCTLGAFAQTGLQQQIDHAVEGHLQQRLAKQAAAEGWKGLRFIQTSAPQTSIDKLAPCSQQLGVKDGGDNRNWSRQRFTLTCANGGWTVTVLTEVKVFASAVTAKQVINRGETLTSRQLALQEVEITKINSGFYPGLEKVIGQGAKRRIRAGQLLTPALVAPAWVIQRGQQVTVVANKDGIAASIQGEALANGAVGDIIRVRNISSKKTIEAKVVAAGVVTTTY